jgi:N-acetylmuramoyl-L-alanine amidase
MRAIKYIVLHCTASSQSATKEAIQRYWRETLGWQNPGYHYLIAANGDCFQLQHTDKIANGVAGYNSNSIHISYIGGIDRQGKPLDNRTPEQLKQMETMVRQLKNRFPQAEILGHRDFPEVKKACPSFDVKTWLKTINL